MTDIVISSEAQFRAQLKKLDFDEAGLLYRGQADSKWPVNCSAVRRLARGLANSVESRLTNSLLVGYLEFLIAKARMLNVLPYGFDRASPDLELLALLQHQGAATGASHNGGEFLATSGELHWDAQPATLDNPKSGLHPRRLA